ncbi:MAG TPA: amino acid adenylation domain-containing protein [Pseudonocardiaceae bacterium]
MTDQRSAEDLRRAVLELPEDQRALLSLRLARAHERRRKQIPALPRGGEHDRLPCSSGQERLYFLHELDPTSPTYLMPIMLRLTGRPKVDALRVALSTVLDRHEALRTGFAVDSGAGLRQVVVPAGVLAVDLPVREIGSAELAGQVRAFTREPFDLATPPLLRAVLFRLVDTEDEWALAMCVHHIVVDGWSLGVLVDDLAEIYQATVTGREPELPELAIQYADFAAWQREQLDGPAAAEHLDYWREALADPPTLELPADRPRPANQSFAGSSIPLDLSPALTEQLNALGQRERATLFMVLLAAFSVVLNRWSGLRDVVIGTPVAGRGRPELDRLVGFFVNTVALRIGVSETGSFRDLVGLTRERCLAGYAHENVPFERVAREVDTERRGGRSTLLRVLLALRNVRLDPLRLPDVDVTVVDLPRIGTDLDLSIELSPTDAGGLSGWLVFATDLFDPETAEQLAAGLRSVLTAVAADPDHTVRSLPVLTEDRRQRIVAELSGASVLPCPARTLPDWFADQVAKTPDAVAVVADGQDSVTYQELDERANRLAHWLREHGVGVEDRVGVCLDRSVDLVVALLAVLKAGGTYLPLDPDHPIDRIEALVKDAEPVLVLTDIDDLAGYPSTAPEVSISAANAAYVLYTSGSTGTPKGVQITHHGLANRLLWMCDTFGFATEDVVLHKTPISSDPSLWELLVPLLRGARLVLAAPRRHADSDYLVDVLTRHQITACDFVPSMLRIALTHPDFGQAAASLRLVVCGGEELPADVAERLLTLAPQIDLENFYGPTEAAIDVSAHRVRVPLDGPIPIGVPVSGTELYVLDELGRVAPIGVPGELMIGGVQLATGYLSRPGQTAAGFVPHPIRPGARLYRTGDRARWRHDGTLDYLGRLDHQVKVRGYRVEPGEVEARLREHADVTEAVVLAVPDEHGEHRLIGYLTGAPPGADQLRQYLARLLPTPMIPGRFVVLERFPLTGNGKIDRRALLDNVDGEVLSRAEPVAPTDDLQEVLVGVWSDVLGAGDIGVLDDFFDHGGHSLLATLVVSQVRELFRIELPLHFFVEAPTVAALADLVRERGTASGVDVDRVAELVLQVQRMTADEVHTQLRD